MVCTGTGSCLWWDTGEAMRMNSKWKRCTEEELLWFWFSSLSSMLSVTKSYGKKKKNRNQKTPNNHEQAIKSVYIYQLIFQLAPQLCPLTPSSLHRLGLVARVTLLCDRAFLTNQRFPQHAGLGGRHWQSVQKSFSRHSTADKNMGKFFHPQELACDWQLMKDFVRITEGTCTSCGNLSPCVVLK